VVERSELRQLFHHPHRHSGVHSCLFRRQRRPGQLSRGLPQRNSVAVPSLYLTAPARSPAKWLERQRRVSAATSPSRVTKKGLVTQSTRYRTNPDVAYDASPSTGFPSTIRYKTEPRLRGEQSECTADAAPQWAGLIAIADQGGSRRASARSNGATKHCTCCTPCRPGFPDITQLARVTGPSPVSAWLTVRSVTGGQSRRRPRRPPT